VGVYPPPGSLGDRAGVHQFDRHLRAEPAGLDIDPFGAEGVDEPIEKRPGDLRGGRTDETRPPAAPTKLGRRPFLVSAYRVNWDTARIAPPTSRRERFIFPSSSSKIRSVTIFPAARIGRGDPDEEEEPSSDLGDPLAFDIDRGAIDPLNDDPHQPSSWSRSA